MVRLVSWLCCGLSVLLLVACQSDQNQPGPKPASTPRVAGTPSAPPPTGSALSDPLTLSGDAKGSITQEKAIACKDGSWRVSGKLDPLGQVTVTVSGGQIDIESPSGGFKGPFQTTSLGDRSAAGKGDVDGYGSWAGKKATATGTVLCAGLPAATPSTGPTAPAGSENLTFSGSLDGLLRTQGGAPACTPGHWQSFGVVGNAEYEVFITTDAGGQAWVIDVTSQKEILRGKVKIINSSEKQVGVLNSTLTPENGFSGPATADGQLICQNPIPGVTAVPVAPAPSPSK